MISQYWFETGSGWTPKRFAKSEKWDQKNENNQKSENKHCQWLKWKQEAGSLPLEGTWEQQG
jgi:hypothetical protein